MDNNKKERFVFCSCHNPVPIEMCGRKWSTALNVAVQAPPLNAPVQPELLTHPLPIGALSSFPDCRHQACLQQNQANSYSHGTKAIDKKNKAHLDRVVRENPSGERTLKLAC